MGATNVPIRTGVAPMGVSGPASASPPVIVAGLDTLAGLQVARILGQRRIRIIGVATDRRHRSCYSRACDRVIEADTSGDELIAALEQLAAGGDRGVVIPCTDEAVMALARRRERVEPAHALPLADLRRLETLGNKAAFATHAVDQGLPVPRTIVLGEHADAERAARSLRFPCALKPAARTPSWMRRAGQKGFKIETPAEMLRTYERVCGWTDRLVAQEWVPGDDSQGYLFRGYFDRGRALATFMARIVRQWPPEMGIAVSIVACRNEAVERLAARVFTGSGYNGFGLLEVKRDAETGEYLILEANVGRPTAMTGIAERGGVELLYTGYCHALGWPLPPQREQRDVGARFFFLRNDVRAALALHRQGRLSARAWVRSLRGPKADALISLTDPLPALIDLLRATSNFLTRAIRPRSN